jgi:hypothetical protein
MKYSWKYDRLSNFFLEYEKTVAGENDPVLMKGTTIDDQVVFEGDIIVARGNVGVIEHDEGCLCTRFYHIKPIYSLKLKYSLLERWNDLTTVIGNIYENPSLLEEIINKAKK